MNWARQRGGFARARSLTEAQRSAIASKAANVRWNNGGGGGLRAAVNTALERDERHRPAASVVHVVLPVPPSVNNLFATSGERRHLSKRYTEWRREAGSLLNLAHLPRVAGPYVLDLDFAAGAADLDNLIKPVADLLVAHGVTDDDRDLRELHVRRTFPQPGLVGVTVRAYRNGGAP